MLVSLQESERLVPVSSESPSLPLEVTLAILVTRRMIRNRMKMLISACEEVEQEEAWSVVITSKDRVKR